jgi:hypothetical protein
MRERPPMLQAVEYRALTDAQRIERLSGWSLDRCEELLSQPLSEVLSQPQCGLILGAQMQCVRAVFNAVVKSGLGNKRLEVEREKILADLSKREFGEEKS